MGNWRNISNLPEAPWRWLEAYMPKEGPIFPYSYATYRRIRKLVSVKIPKDGLRHSMASYGYHELGIETTVEILGQESGYEVFKRHYKPGRRKGFFWDIAGYTRRTSQSKKQANALPRTGRRNRGKHKIFG